MNDETPAQRPRGAPTKVRRLQKESERENQHHHPWGWKTSLKGMNHLGQGSKQKRSQVRVKRDSWGCERRTRAETCVFDYTTAVRSMSADVACWGTAAANVNILVCRWTEQEGMRVYPGMNGRSLWTYIPKHSYLLKKKKIAGFVTGSLTDCTMFGTVEFNRADKPVSSNAFVDRPHNANIVACCHTANSTSVMPAAVILAGRLKNSNLGLRLGASRGRGKCSTKIGWGLEVMGTAEKGSFIFDPNGRTTRMGSSR